MILHTKWLVLLSKMKQLKRRTKRIIIERYWTLLMSLRRRERNKKKKDKVSMDTIWHFMCYISQLCIKVTRIKFQELFCNFLQFKTKMTAPYTFRDQVDGLFKNLRMSYSATRKPYVVLTPFPFPFPFQGHINPLFQLAKLLHLRGFPYHHCPHWTQSQTLARIKGSQCPWWPRRLLIWDHPRWTWWCWCCSRHNLSLWNNKRTLAPPLLWSSC